ncbi:MAG: GNAT family N-acetyltransferase [Gemmatimonadaceae bacterium]|nr:GNAT family N-acetyltransferase [Gemmatimonadaceae bacterium]
MANLVGFPHFEPLGAQHDRAAFSCGTAELDEYIKVLAGQHARKKISTTTVLLVDGPHRIAGYHSLSSTRLDLGELPPDLARQYPRYAEGIPATLLGRLAVDLFYRGHGWGEALLMNALERSYMATGVVASAFVIVRAIDSAATQFYARYGFSEFPGDSRRLYLPMRTVQHLVAGP